MAQYVKVAAAKLYTLNFDPLNPCKVEEGEGPQKFSSELSHIAMTGMHLVVV